MISFFKFVHRIVFTPIGVVAFCVFLGSVVLPNARGQNAPTSAEIDGWVKELSSNSYLLRKRATTNLTRVGEPAVDDLVAQLDSGDLETTERVLGILQKIAARAPVLATSEPSENAESPASEDNRNNPSAWDELLRISQLGGSRGTRAKVATDEVRGVRRVQAVELLGAAGVFIGIADFTIGAVSQPRRIVEVDDRFQGDVAVLSLLQWVDGIDYGRIKGGAVRKEVLKGIVRMPDLKTLVLLDGEIDSDGLSLLGDMAELRHLELRYVPLNGKLVDQLATLPIRVSLTLNGTLAPAERVAALQKSVPGLEIIFKHGGFLGVRCNNTLNECLILEVVRDQAAERAGLLPGDVVVDIDGTTIKKFTDLQGAIDNHFVGDEIKIRYQRDGIPRETTAKLGKRILP